ncbi:hypothetical protein GW17_00056464 [Ensete ventricosum]|nr:hypothetical protein GW17_00056464 [Ensete ventricosum]
MATANPLARATDHLQGADDCSQGPPAKGRSTVAKAPLQRGGRWQERPLAGAAPVQGGVASPRGAPEGSSACPRRRRAASPPAQGSGGGGDGVDGGKERVGNPFEKRMILSL